MTVMLSDITKVARRFRRSVRLDADLGDSAALDGFIGHESNVAVIETMIRLIAESGQRAFTVTGPYGGGKSSLALALAALVGGDAGLRRRMLGQFGNPAGINDAFPVDDEWLVVPVVGRRGDPVVDVRQAVSDAVAAEHGSARTKKRKMDATGRDVIERLEDEAQSRAKGGVLLIIDEMGKFLEGASRDDIDIHFFQELAEAANRCSGRLIVVGILHQAFERYASGLGGSIRDEWAKVQGRFVDIPFVTAVDDVMNLIGCAIAREESGHAVDHPACGVVAEVIAKRRPGSATGLLEKLKACWPLHPVSAALLGPISRSRFSQNERSVMGFLVSSEPSGFQEFLRDTVAAKGASFGPDLVWDYLRANLEPAIIASTDGHRWAIAVEAIERCEARGGSLHSRLAKTIAAIDLFRDGSGIVAENAILRVCVGVDAGELEPALDDLAKWKVAVFRKHLDAWALYAGSDFDIESAVVAARARNPAPDFGNLGTLTYIPPVPAKEHYWRTGALRWFDTELVPLSESRRSVADYSPVAGASGKFLLAIPSGEESESECMELCQNASRKAGRYPVAVGIPDDASSIRDLALELTALEDVRQNSPALEGDSVARREIHDRLAATSGRFEDELRLALGGAKWFIRGNVNKPVGEWPPTSLVSELVDKTFDQAPIIQSEMINRIRPSNNIQAAVRILLHRMIDGEDREFLGIEGFGPERALYSTILEASGLHGKNKSGSFAFLSPVRRRPVGGEFSEMWKSAKDLIRETDKEPRGLQEIYELWSAPPFGIMPGLLPVVAMALILSQKDIFAVYVEGMFQPELNDLVADKLLQDARQIGLRRVGLAPRSKNYLTGMAKAVSAATGGKLQPNALSVARELVHFAFKLPAWVRLTKTLSPEAQQVRSMLLNASDPIKTLFVDLPDIFERKSEAGIARKIGEILHELGNAYPNMLSDLKVRMLDSLGQKSNYGLDRLRKRAEIVSGVSGDHRLNAFANRLTRFEGTEEDMEALAGLAVNKPPRDWADRDRDQAGLELADFALKFRHAEVLASVKGREPTRHALGIVFGTGEQGRTVMKSFDIGTEEEAQVEALASELMDRIGEVSTDGRLALAALARVGSRLLEGGGMNDATRHPGGAVR